MENSSLEKIKKEIKFALEKQVISGRTLLDRFCVIEEKSRRSPAYVDPRYAPFYYYLGKIIKPKNIMEIGFDLGLLSSCFLLSCKTVENFFGFKEIEKNAFFSNKIGTTNIKKVYKKNKQFYTGDLFDKDFYAILESQKWDLIIINEEKEYDKQLQYIETAWSKISENGILIIEYVKSHKASKEAFASFSESKNIESLIFETRYGTGLLKKT